MAKKYIPPPQSLANLRPWKPGDPSPNPGGRPKKRPVTDRYYERGEGPLPDVIRLQFNEQLRAEVLPPGSTWADANALRRWMDTVMQGGHPSAREIREAIEGKAPMRLEIQGTQRKEVTFRVIFEERITLPNP